MIAGSAVRHRGVPVAVAASLLLVYGLTLARDVTFWDAGEFIAAAADFGIPHPPGTPLYVLLLRVTLLALGSLGVPAAVATSLVSAACTAGSCALGATVLARATRDPLAAVAGGVAAGTMASVWLNASETEVYAAALALSLVTVWAAERAGRTRSYPWSALVAYLLVLAVPLHLSALLVAPAALLLVLDPDRPGSADSLTRGVIVIAAVVTAFALGRMTVAAAGLALVVIATGGAVVMRRQRRAAVSANQPASRGWLLAVLVLVAMLLAASALLVLLVRARHDPGINQGNPSTWSALVELVARRQYAVAPPWPRQAPLWLQLGNLLLYADWQVALSLGPTIFPTGPRTAATLLFAALGVFGSRAHFRHDRRTWAGFALLLAAGTVGAVLYLNLKAGPSFGHGVLPADALREARERDYFFVLGWWTWGVWAGMGAVMLARRARVPGWVGLAGAAVPLLLNWRAIDRTRTPEHALPRATAEGLLTMVPPRSVLFVAGDNDSYPLWYAQRALGLRRDVTVITTPLLPADWYRRELARRHELVAPVGEAVPPWRGRATAIREIAAAAAARGRPVAMAASMPAADRALVGGRWTMRGPVYVADGLPGAGGAGAELDTVSALAWQRRLTAMVGEGEAHPATDGTTRYMLALLRCPGTLLAHRRAGLPEARSDSLAPHCNLR